MIVSKMKTMRGINGLDVMFGQESNQKFVLVHCEYNARTLSLWCTHCK
jgi:hypothetical protein